MSIYCDMKNNGLTDKQGLILILIVTLLAMFFLH